MAVHERLAGVHADHAGDSAKQRELSGAVDTDDSLSFDRLDEPLDVFVERSGTAGDGNISKS